MYKRASVVHYGDSIRRRSRTLNVISRRAIPFKADAASMPPLSVGDHQVIPGRCEDHLSLITSGSVDVVVTSPPYNIGLRYDTYQDDIPEAAYVDWLLGIASQLNRILTSDGSFFLNISGSGTQPWLPFSVVNSLRDFFQLQNHIVWVKSISVEMKTSGHFKPIISERFLNQNHEHIFHFTKTNTVRLDRLAIGLPFVDKSNVTRWGHKRDLRCRGNTWFIPYKTVKSKAQKYNHPGTFPIELPLWCMFLHGKADARVLDPFSGTGTTLVAAHLAGARGIGIDLDERYNAIALERLRILVGRTMQLTLTAEEMDLLLLQDPETAADGGFQGLMVSLQNRLNKSSGLLTLTPDDLERIPRYAFDYRKGGWESRLTTIFGRSLGPKLGR